MSSYNTKSAVRTVRKTCDKCHKAGWFRPRETRCKRPETNRFGKSGYYCYGYLTRIERNPIVKTDGNELREAVMAAQILDPKSAEAAEKIRSDARKNLVTAEARLHEAMVDLKRVTTRIGKWHAKIKYLSRRASISNQDVQTERDRRKRQDRAQ